MGDQPQNKKKAKIPPSSSAKAAKKVSAPKSTAATRRASAKRTRVAASEAALAKVADQDEATEALHNASAAGMSVDVLLKMIDEFTKASELVAKEGREFQDTWVATVAAENVIFKKRNRLLVWMVAILLIITAVGQGRSVFQVQPLLSDVEKAVDAIEKNQGGIDSLVAFVQDIQKQTCNEADLPDGEECPPSQTEILLQTFTSVLCASDDPVRLEACRELGLNN